MICIRKPCNTGSYPISPPLANTPADVQGLAQHASELYSLRIILLVNLQCVILTAFVTASKVTSVCKPHSSCLFQDRAPFV